MMIWACFGVMTAVVAGILVRGVLRDEQASAPVSRAVINAALFAERLRELDQDQEAGRLADGEYEGLRAELERALLADVEGEDVTAGGVASVRATSGPSRLGVAALVLSIPVAATGVYLAEGQYPAVRQWQDTRAMWEPLIVGSLQGRNMSEEETRQLTSADYIRVLQAILQKTPDHVEGWESLGYAYMQVGLPMYAETAFIRAADLARDDVDLQLLIVESKLAHGKGSLDPAGMARLTSVLQKAPDHPKARMMLGMAHYNQGRFGEAILVWQELLAEIPQASEGADILRSSIAKAEQKRAGTSTPQPSGPRLIVKVEIDPALLSAFPKPAWVMVYAKQVDGLPMPVAIHKQPLETASLTVTLSDADAMAPMARLSTSPRVRVFARLSQTGSASTQAGDVTVESDALSVGQDAVDVELKLSSPVN